MDFKTLCPRFVSFFILDLISNSFIKQFQPIGLDIAVYGIKYPFTELLTVTFKDGTEIKA